MGRDNQGRLKFYLKSNSKMMHTVVNCRSLFEGDSEELQERTVIKFEQLQYLTEFQLNYVDFMCHIEMSPVRNTTKYKVVVESDPSVTYTRSAKAYVEFVERQVASAAEAAADHGHRRGHGMRNGSPASSQPTPHAPIPVSTQENGGCN